MDHSASNEFSLIESHRQTLPSVLGDVTGSERLGGAL